MFKKCKNIGVLVGIITFVTLLVSRSASASLQYLDNNANYPVAYYHANYREYVDLTSCTYREEGNYIVYAAGYIAYTMGADSDSRIYRSRLFRQSKDGVRPPQFYNESVNKWITIPSYDYNEIQRYKAEKGYMGYINTYYPYAYFMFKIVYKKIHGVSYPDNLAGHTP